MAAASRAGRASRRCPRWRGGCPASAWSLRISRRSGRIDVIPASAGMTEYGSMPDIPQEILAATVAADHPKIAALADAIASRSAAKRPADREKALLADLVERSRARFVSRAATLPRPSFP